MTATLLNLVLERSIDQYADYETVIDGILLDLTDYELKAVIQRTYTSEISIEFTVEVIQATVPAIVRLRLSRHQTATMIPGRYVWDLVGSKDGISRRLREGGAIVQPGVSDPDIGGLDPNIIAAINSAITTHNLDPFAHPGLAGGGSGGSIKVPFAWGDASPKPIYTALAGQTIFTVQVVLQTAMLAGSTLSVGDAGDPQRLLAATQIDPSIAAEFEVNPGFTYTANTQVLLTITPASDNTTGSGFVLIEV